MYGVLPFVIERFRPSAENNAELRWKQLSSRQIQIEFQPPIPAIDFAAWIDSFQQ